MEALFVLLCVVIFWMMYNIGKNENDRKKMLKNIEYDFLLGIASIEQYKYQALEILKIVYEKAAETDPQFIKDYEKIVKSVENRFEEFGDKWIKNLNNMLGYKTEYQNWREATRYIERLIADTKKQNGHRSQD